MTAPAGVVSYFGAGVLHIAGLQQAGIGEVLLVDGAAAVVVQVLRDEFFWLCAAALVILAAGFRGILGHRAAGCWQRLSSQRPRRVKPEERCRLWAGMGWLGFQC